MMKKFLRDRRQFAAQERSMTRRKLIEAVAERTGFRIVDCREILDASWDIMEEVLSEGRPVKLHGIGSLYPRALSKPFLSPYDAKLIPLENTDEWRARHFWVSFSCSIKLRVSLARTFARLNPENPNPATKSE